MDMKNFNYSRLIWPAVILLLVFLVWKYGSGFISRIFGSTVSSAAAENIVKNATSEIEQGSADVMSCGLTYAVMAKKLYDLIYGSSFLGAWKNVNEEELGNTLSAVQPQEYERLSLVYWDYRQAAVPWWQINAQLYTLSEDIRRTLSDSEIQKYIPGLPLGGTPDVSVLEHRSDTWRA